MTAVSSPVKHTVRTAIRAVSGLVGALMLTACVSGQHLQHSEAQAGAQDEQRMRLFETRLQLAALHFQEGRPDVALKELEQAMQAHAGSADAYNLQGWVHMARQDHVAARASFDQALRLQPNDADTLYNLAWLLCQQRQYVHADQHFDASLAAPRGSDEVRVRAWLGKGVCLRQSGQDALALPALEKAYELAPGSPVAAYNFADVLQVQGQLERARFYARRLNNGEDASAQSLWLGIQIERKLGDNIAMRQLADQLHKRFPDSKEWQRYEQGTFDD